MILLVDNYDSFTYNLAQYIAEFHEVIVKLNVDPELFYWAEKANKLVLSPGPGVPKEAGMLMDLLEVFIYKKPILGICLGHEAIGEFLGGRLKVAPEVRHGKISFIEQRQKTALFAKLPPRFEAMRYHSLILEQTKLPETLAVLACSTDDHEIMAIQLKGYPVYGVQFHPESIGTPTGKNIIQNFILQEADCND